jgi:hypothetical protein
MAYKILKQFQPNTSNVWVEKLSDEDSIFVFDTEAEAESKVSELQASDPTRKYTIVTA